MIDPRLLRLHADDNVLTVIRTLEPGDELVVEGTRAPITARLPLGHKVAARAIAAGEKIVKYGAPIGSATLRHRARRARPHAQSAQRLPADVCAR